MKAKKAPGVMRPLITSRPPNQMTAATMTEAPSSSRGFISAVARR